MKGSSSSEPGRVRPRRWRRAGIRAFLILILAVVLLPVIAVLSLRSTATRQAILGRVTATVSLTAGVEMTVRDFSLDFGRSLVLEIDGLTVSKPGSASRPFLTVRRARAVVSWRPLVDDGVRLLSLSIERPVLDLGAPLPESDEERAPIDSGVEILDVRLTGGVVRSAPPTTPQEILFDSWSVEGISASGSLRGGALDVDLTADLVVRSRHREPIVASARADLGLTDRGEIHIESLVLRGTGLDLLASGTGRARPIRPETLDFDLTVDAGTLFPDLTAEGHLGAKAVLVGAASGSMEGRLRVDAREFPAELFSPWLGAVRLEEFGVAGTRIDVDADLAVSVPLDLDRAASGSFDGSAEIRWRRDEELLLAATVRSLFDPDRDRPGGVHLAVEADLFPAEAGSRRLEGEFVAAGWRELPHGELRAATLRIEEPDLAAAVDRLGLFRGDESPLRPVGELVAKVDAEGALDDPRVRIDAHWQLDGKRLVDISARTLVGPGVQFALEASLLPDAAGRRRVEGELRTPSWSSLKEAQLSARLSLELPDVSETARTAERVLEELATLPGVRSWIAATTLDPLSPHAGGLGGSLSGDLWISGRAFDPDVKLGAIWSPDQDEIVELSGRARPFGPGPVDTTLTFRNLDAARLWNLSGITRDDRRRASELEGTLGGTLSVSGRRGAMVVRLDAEAEALQWRDYPAIAQLRLRLSGEAGTIDLLEASGTLEPRYEWQGESRFDLTGHLEFDQRVRWAELQAELIEPAIGVDRAGATLRLDGGTLHVESLSIDSAESSARVRGMFPLGTLGLGRRWGQTWPLAADVGPLRIDVDDLQLELILDLLGMEEQADSWHADLDGSFSFDGLSVDSATGTVEISDIAFEIDDEHFEAAETIVVRVAGGRVELSPSSLVATGEAARVKAPLELSGAMQLDRNWSAGDGVAELVEELWLDAHGTVPTALFQPFLAGGVASGTVALDARVRGGLDALSAEIRVRGDEASLLYNDPYPTKLDSVELELEIRKGEVVLIGARAGLNGGSCRMTGHYGLESDLSLELQFDQIRYRLDHGVTVLMGGRLELDWPARGRAGLSGDILVERAVLRRAVHLDREVLRVLFEPEPGSTADRILGRVDVDLILTTDDGLQIRNNLADLRADFGQFKVGGTLAQPVFDGRVEIEPGGRLHLLGQTLRIDEGALIWSGDPPGEPRVVLETTSSLDDPTIRQDWRSSLVTGMDRGPGEGGSLDLRQQETSSEQFWESFTTDLVTLSQNRFAGALAGGLDRTELTYEPLPLFGETETEARITLAQHLSPRTTFIASNDPRKAEAQTYILDLHNFPVAPRLRAQIFTNDDKNEGMTLQQTVTLGGKSRQEETDPRLHETRIDIVEGPSRRRLRKAIGYRKGEPFPRGAALDVEVDVIEAMRGKGYPQSTVEVQVEPLSDRKVDLVVSVDSGERLAIVFQGAKLPKSVRRSIVESYGPGDEQASMEAVQRATASALRGQGYLSSRVDLDLFPATGSDPATLRVSIAVGRRIDPGPPVIEGLPEEEAGRLSRAFRDRLARVELAAGDEGADAYLIDLLHGLGYPTPRIVSRDLNENGEQLTVRIDPGSRQHVESIEVVGVDADEARRLKELIHISPGDPLLLESIARVTHAIEDDLRSRGHAAARVRADFRESTPLRTVVRFDVESGPRYRVDAVRYEGMRSSRPGWVERVAATEVDTEFRRDEIAAARGRLYRTGVFKRIRVGFTDVDPPAGSADPKDRTLTFQLEEAPRYQIAYGGRWENHVGLSVVVDAVDRNSLGRGHTSGARVVYGGDIKSLRLYHRIPRVVGPRSTLELFAEAKKEIVDTLTSEGVETWAQVSFPLTRRIQNRFYTVFETRSLTEEMPDPSMPVDDRVISPRLGWQIGFDSRQRTLAQRRSKGVFAGLDVWGSHKSVGSDLTILALFTQLKLFLPIGDPQDGRLSWTQSFRTGLENAKDDSIPVIDRLRLGGEFSVRGYPTDSLGPVGADGEPLGGEVMFVMNQELHSRIWGPVSGLVFLDVGNVWESFGSVDGEFFKSTGGGLRYLSPIGPLRLDVGFPLDQRPDDPDYKVYFGFGQIF